MNVLEYITNLRKIESDSTLEVFQELLNNLRGSIEKSILDNKTIVYLKIFIIDNISELNGIKSNIVYTFFKKDEETQMYKYEATVRTVLKEDFIVLLRKLPVRAFCEDNDCLFLTFDTLEIVQYFYDKNDEKEFFWEISR